MEAERIIQILKPFVLKDSIPYILLDGEKANVFGSTLSLEMPYGINGSVAINPFSIEIYPFYSDEGTIVTHKSDIQVNEYGNADFSTGKSYGVFTISELWELIDKGTTKKSIKVGRYGFKSEYIRKVISLCRNLKIRQIELSVKGKTLIMNGDGLTVKILGTIENSESVIKAKKITK